jgi:hypothetical protein
MQHFDQPPERSVWATRLDPNYTGRFGCRELHGVFLMPKEDDGGPRDVVVLQIPETSDELFVGAMEMATQGRARVVFLCDTPIQARKVAREAAKILPKHCRVSMERALAGAWGEPTMRPHVDAGFVSTKRRR